MPGETPALHVPRHPTHFAEDAKWMGHLRAIVPSSFIPLLHMKLAPESVPDWISLGVAQGEGVVSFYYFACQDEVSFTLLDL
jgi:hypothetical protein